MKKALQLKASVGVYIESLKFSTANDIEVSGHLWQKIRHAEKTRINEGLVFTDAIGSVTLEKRYEQSYDDYKLYGWYFEATLRQPFKYDDYPIDHKTIWIKIKPAGFDPDHLLIPDLMSYRDTGNGVVFGVSPDIVLLGWEMNESFFDYTVTEYDTDFGHNQASHNTQLPVLTFNLVLNRNLLTAFIVNLTLLLVTLFLLYILIIMITSDDRLKKNFDMSVGGAVSSCAGLFFATLIAHIHLRELFPSSGFVYLEFFYLLNYIFIIVTILVVYVFHSNSSADKLFLFKNDAAWVKLAYWPVYLTIANGYTFMHFY